MREIKFRAWHKQRKMMLPVSSWSFYDDCVWIESGESDEYGKLYRPYKINTDVVVMQYTGLKDKNGKEIYEGDIIRIRHPEWTDWEIYSVKYCDDFDYPAFDTCPRIDCDCNGLSYAMACCEVEVIGNIFENPELLSKKCK